MNTGIEKAAENKELINTALKHLKWPTSRPGPRATPPPPGEKPVATRTDQMVVIAYDQERGKPINNSTL
jgi:hypothetical protein